MSEKNYFSQSGKHKSSIKNYNDRFIPSRVQSNHTFSLDQFTKKTEIETEYSKYIKDFSIQDTKKNYQTQKYNNNSLHKQICKNIQEQNHKNPKKKIRPISLQKIWDAPQVINDYYANLLDWSNGGSLGVGLNRQIYLTNTTGLIQILKRNSFNVVTSLKFHPTLSQLLAIGTKSGQIQLFDTYKLKNIRIFQRSSERIASLVWNNSILITGSKDNKIVFCDIKQKNPIVGSLQGHQGQICGLDISENFLASGSNDNNVIIWDLKMTKQIFKLQHHKAAVKALAFCPWNKALLATGGGNKDGTIAFWNLVDGKLSNIYKPNSMVSSLIWNKQFNQIISSHGYPNNQICLWKLKKDKQKPIQVLGHSQKILSMCMSPQKKYLATVSTDQTLRLWNLNMTEQQRIRMSKRMTEIWKI